MSYKIKDIALWLYEEGKNITKEVLEEKLFDAYNQGKADCLQEEANEIIEDIKYNTLRKIKLDKKKLFEDNFYNKPSDEDIVKMKALEYLEEHIGEIILEYKK